MEALDQCKDRNLMQATANHLKVSVHGDVSLDIDSLYKLDRYQPSLGGIITALIL